VSENNHLKVLVADDEAHARLRIADLLATQAYPVNVFEVNNGRAAVETIKRSRPHLLFLDVEMPAMDGFEVVRAVGSEMMPITVFVTAFGGYAIRAFEANALDYLLKPFTDDRFAHTFARTLQRLKEIDERNFALRVASMLSSINNINNRMSYLDRLAIKSSRSVQFVKARQIDWIEADGVYVNVHSNGATWLHRAALSELESQLDPEYFIRIHRTALVNIESIASLKRRSHGEFDVLLRDGAQIKVSRLYRSRLEERLKQSL